MKQIARFIELIVFGSRWLGAVPVWADRRACRAAHRQSDRYRDLLKLRELRGTDRLRRTPELAAGSRPHRVLGLKQKLLGSIVAIAAVNALEWFTDIDRQADSVKLGWVVTILLPSRSPCWFWLSRIG
jgi:hypothetical protein